MFRRQPSILAGLQGPRFGRSGPGTAHRSQYLRPGRQINSENGRFLICPETHMRLRDRHMAGGKAAAEAVGTTAAYRSLQSIASCSSVPWQWSVSVIARPMPRHTTHRNRPTGAIRLGASDCGYSSSNTTSMLTLISIAPGANVPGA